MSGAGIVVECVFEAVKMFGTSRLVDDKGWSKRDVILFTINSKCTKLPKTKTRTKKTIQPSSLPTYLLLLKMQKNAKKNSER